MPGTPTVRDLAAHATRIMAAQVKLRTTMTAVAAQVSMQPPATAATGNQAGAAAPRS
jgi:hypothetical protein